MKLFFKKSLYGFLCHLFSAVLARKLALELVSFRRNSCCILELTFDPNFHIITLATHQNIFPA
jgi:hypothetical protein